MAADDNAFPESYTDPLYASLDAANEQKLGLPTGLISAIRTRGEKSNASAVSEDSARTPYQFIPSTRQSIIKKYGIDPLLSPQNASEAAGLLLKEGLDRNDGDVRSAVGEYIGGPNRSNWGPVTNSYIGRVLGGQNTAKTSALSSDFAKWMADHPAEPGAAAAPAAAAPDALSQDFGDWLKQTGGAPRTGANAIPTAAEEAGQPYVPPVAAPPAAQPSLGDKLIGAGEAGAQALTGAVTGTLGQMGGAAIGLVQDVNALAHGEVNPQNLSTLAQAGQQAGTYAPRTDLGQQYSENVVNALAPVAGLTGELGAMGALAGPARAQIGAAVRAAPAAVMDAAKGARAVSEAAPAVAADAAQAAPAAVSDLVQTAKQAVGGDTDARQILATQAAPDPSIVKSAQRLGIEDYLQPDHVTTNNAYRQVVGAIKSNPQSEVALTEAANLPKVAERASDLIDELGGTNDLSALSDTVKSRMEATHAALSATEDGLYDKLRAEMPPKTDAPAPNVLDFIQKRADDLGGPQNLSPLEKTVLRKLSPTGSTKVPEDPWIKSLSPEAQRQVAAQLDTQGKGAGQPTYALLDDVRKDIGAATRMKGPFADSDTGLAKALYAEISKDQESAVSSAGLSDTWAAAKSATGVRKGLEDDLSSLFGKNLDRSVAASGGTGLPGAIRNLASGDTSGLTRLMSAIPADMRQSVTASGLGTVFRNAATRGEMNFTGFSKWMDGLTRNRQAYAALMSNLPLSARKQVMALYKVSKGISDSLGARTKTGALNTIKEEMMRGTDGLMSSLYNAAGSSAGKFAAHTVLGHIPFVGHGLAAALTSAISAGKSKPLAAVDALLASPEFLALAKTPAGPARSAAVRSVAVSPVFGSLMRKVGTPMTISERERWIVHAMQGAANQDQTQRRPALALVR